MLFFPGVREVIRLLPGVRWPLPGVSHTRLREVPVSSSLSLSSSSKSKPLTSTFARAFFSAMPRRAVETNSVRKGQQGSDDSVALSSAEWHRWRLPERT